MATSFKRSHAGRPPLTHTSARDFWTLTSKSGSVSCGVTAPFSWVLVCARFCLCPPRELKHSSVSGSMESLGPGAHKVCLSPLSVSGGNGVRLNANLPLLLSLWDFSFALGLGIPPQSCSSAAQMTLQHSAATIPAASHIVPYIECFLS